MSADKLALESRPVYYVIAAGTVLLIWGALTALWNWSAKPPEFVPGRLSAPSVASVSAHSGGQGDAVHVVDLDGGFDFSWWPANVAPAARMYQCAPPKLQGGRDTLVVWTDAQNEVSAYGAALEGELPPQYVAPLAIAGSQDPRRSVHPSVPGFRVHTAKNPYTLTLRDIRLDCVASSDD